FVIHEHHARRLHWDLRLEHDGVLASWAVPNGIPLDPGENRFAAATEDHPLEYLEFAGEIPKGEYGAGKIAIWDSGTFECLKWDGIRAIAYSRPGQLRLESRNRNDITSRYPELARLNRALGAHSAIVDGEIVSLDADGRPNFQSLQRRMHLGSSAQAKTAAKH